MYENPYIDDNLIIEIVKQVADGTGLEPGELPPPLARTIDPDALKDVLAHGTLASPISVSFTYADTEVVATHADDLTVDVTNLNPRPAGGGR